MESKVYTAQEMRVVADNLDSVYVAPECEDKKEQYEYLSLASMMLRQAADALDREEKREKKYEYGVLWLYDNTVTNNMGEYRHWAEEIVRGSDPNKCRLARREVGEWEEVRDGE